MDSIRYINSIVLFIAATVFSAHREMRHSVHIFDSLEVDSALYLNHTPNGACDSILGFTIGDKKIKAREFPDSLGFADSTRAAWKADSSGKADTARAAYIADTVKGLGDTLDARINGTENYHAKFNADGNSIGDAIISDDGSTATVGGGLDISANMAVGNEATLNASRILTLYNTYTNTSGAEYGLSSTLLNSQILTGNHYSYNLYFYNVWNGTEGAHVQQTYGFSGFAKAWKDNNLTQGGFGLAQVANGATIDYGRGLEGQIEALNGGTITTAMGLYSKVDNNTGGTITNPRLLEGIYTGGGTYTNTKYGIYFTGDEDNRFQGNISIVSDVNGVIVGGGGDGKIYYNSDDIIFDIVTTGDFRFTDGTVIVEDTLNLDYSTANRVLMTDANKNVVASTITQRNDSTIIGTGEEYRIHHEGKKLALSHYNIEMMQFILGTGVIGPSIHIKDSVAPHNGLYVCTREVGQGVDDSIMYAFLHDSLVSTPDAYFRRKVTVDGQLNLDYVSDSPQDQILYNDYDWGVRGCDFLTFPSGFINIEFSGEDFIFYRTSAYDAKLVFTREGAADTCFIIDHGMSSLDISYTDNARLFDTTMVSIFRDFVNIYGGLTVDETITADSIYADDIETGNDLFVGDDCLVGDNLNVEDNLTVGDYASIRSDGNCFELGDTVDNSIKNPTIYARQYDTGEEGLCQIYVYNDDDENKLFIGGGTGSLNAATQVRIYAAPDHTTLGGAECFRVDGADSTVYSHYHFNANEFFADSIQVGTSGSMFSEIEQDGDTLLVTSGGITEKYISFDIIDGWTTSFAEYCSLYDDATYRSRALCYFLRNDRDSTLRISIPVISGTKAGTSLILRNPNIKSSKVPTIKIPVRVYNSASLENGWLQPYFGYLKILQDNGNDLDAGTGGTRPCEVNYRF